MEHTQARENERDRVKEALGSEMMTRTQKGQRE